MNQQMLKYYHEVLGINVIPKDFLSDPITESVDGGISIWREDLKLTKTDISDMSCDLLFLSSLSSMDQESLYQEPHFSLFEKMKKAMGLEHILIKTLEHVGESEHEVFHDLLKMKARVVLIMKMNPERGEFKVTKEFKFLETYSPQALSGQANLKKNSWEDLQKVMKLFRDTETTGTLSN